MPGITVPRTQKAPFARRKLLSFVDFSGGMNDKVSPLLLENNEAAAIQNMNMLEKGTLQKRHGYTKRFASTFAAGPVRGLTNYRKENGTSRLVFGADGKLFYDQPNFSQLYDAQSEWESTGVLRSGVTTTETSGDVKPVIGTKSALGFLSLGAQKSASLGGTREHREKVWRTQTLDLTGISDPTTGRVVSTKTTPSGTTIVMETRSSADGVTWGAWSALGVGDTITSPGTDRKMQFRLRFNSTAGLRASAQSVNILFDQTSTATTLSTGYSTTARWDFATANDTLWIVNGEVAKKWDGTTFGDMAGSPPLGKFVVFHKQRLFIAGASAARSRVYFSDVGAPETWGALSFIDVGKGDGDAITGLAVLNDVLIITKDNSVWLLSGDSSSTFVLRRATDEGGCTVKQGIALIKDTLAWLGKDGIRLFDGVRSALGSEKISTTFRGLNERQLAQAAGIFWGPEQHYFISVPEGASVTNNVVLVYDALRTAWTVYRGIPAGEWCIFRQYNEDTLVFGSSTTGQIYSMDTTGYSDDGAAIDAFLVTKHATLAGGIEAPSLVPDVFVACREPDQQSTTATISFYKDLGAETSTISLTLAAQALNVLRAIPSTVQVSLPRSLGVKLRHNAASRGFVVNAIDVRYSPKGIRAT